MESVDVAFGHRLWWVRFIHRGERARQSRSRPCCSNVPFPTTNFNRSLSSSARLSETAFIRRVGDQWSLRWFTPTVEVDLCGHATLATVHVLLNELDAPGAEFFFATRSGVLSGRRLPDGLVGIDLPRAYLEPIDPAVLADALGQRRRGLPSRVPRVCSRSSTTTRRCALTNVDPISLFLVPSSLIIAACYGGPDVDVSIRVFAPRLGLAEDPVTGSALCAVAPWWVEKVGSPTVAVRQASTRGGIMFARLFERNVEVAGMARTFFSGEIYP